MTGSCLSLIVREDTHIQHWSLELCRGEASAMDTVLAKPHVPPTAQGAGLKIQRDVRELGNNSEVQEPTTKNPSTRATAGSEHSSPHSAAEKGACPRARSLSHTKLEAATMMTRTISAPFILEATVQNKPSSTTNCLFLIPHRNEPA